LKTFPEESIDMVMFSPPYYGLRIYGKETDSIWGGDETCSHEWNEERMTLIHENRNFLKGTQEKAGFCVKCGSWKGQLGLEPSWKLYVQHMVEICREIKRVLKKTGSMWIVVGDTYFGEGHGGNTFYKTPSGLMVKSVKQGRASNYVPQMSWVDETYQHKCLMGIPWRLAFALIDDGWILRNALVWHKPNAMPESVKDRFTNTYENILFFVKNKKYYFNLDVVRLPHKRDWRFAGGSLNPSKTRPHGTGWATKVGRHDDVRQKPPQMNPLGKNPGDTLNIYNTKYEAIEINPTSISRYRNMRRLLGLPEGNEKGKNPGDAFTTSQLPQLWMPRRHRSSAHELEHPLGKNPGDYWSISTKPFKGAHFAVYPPELCAMPILSGCPPDGIVLDPMAGAGTTCLTAQLINLKRWDLLRYNPNEIAQKTKWDLKWIGIEINPKYVEIAKHRLEPFLIKRLTVFVEEALGNE